MNVTKPGIRRVAQDYNFCRARYNKTMCVHIATHTHVKSNESIRVSYMDFCYFSKTPCKDIHDNTQTYITANLMLANQQTDLVVSQVAQPLQYPEEDSSSLPAFRYWRSRSKRITAYVRRSASKRCVYTSQAKHIHIQSNVKMWATQISVPFQEHHAKTSTIMHKHVLRTNLMFANHQTDVVRFSCSSCISGSTVS